MEVGELPHTAEAAAVPIVSPATADWRFMHFHTVSHFLALRFRAAVPDGCGSSQESAVAHCGYQTDEHHGSIATGDAGPADGRKSAAARRSSSG